MREGTRKRQYFDLAVASLRNVLRPSPPGYVCPLCLELFEDPEDLSLEHVPPASIGGKAICLTCRVCNSQSGHSVDAALHWESRIRGFFVRGGRTERAQLLIDEVKLNVDFARDEKGIHIVVPPKQNPPDIETRFREAMEQAVPDGKEMTISKSARYPQQSADTGYLKAAYLAAFSKFGYRWVLSQALDCVRRQIQQPTANHLRVFRVYLGQEHSSKSGIYLAHKPMTCLVVTMNKTAVFLPWIEGAGADVYRRLSECRSKGRSAKFSYEVGWGWPSRMELALDQIPPNEF